MLKRSEPARHVAAVGLSPETPSIASSEEGFLAEGSPSAPVSAGVRLLPAE